MGAVRVPEKDARSSRKPAVLVLMGTRSRTSTSRPIMTSLPRTCVCVHTCLCSVLSLQRQFLCIVHDQTTHTSRNLKTEKRSSPSGQRPWPQYRFASPRFLTCLSGSHFLRKPDDTAPALAAPSTAVNSPLLEFPGGQKLSFAAGLSKSVPRPMHLFAEFPEGCVSTGWIRGQEKAWPTTSQGQPQNPGCRRESCHRENLPGTPAIFQR